jgi:hypothetical protein
MRKEYSGIPGTTVFDGEQSRRGYHLNQFCMSLLNPANRNRFKADEEGQKPERDSERHRPAEFEHRSEVQWLSAGASRKVENPRLSARVQTASPGSIAKITSPVGVTTRKCSECTTSWTKHERAARWYVRSTLVMVAARVAAGVTSLTCQEPNVYRGLSRTAAVDPQATFVSLNGEDGPCPFPVIHWCRQGLGAGDESIPSASVNYSVSEIRLGEVR